MIHGLLLCLTLIQATPDVHQQRNTTQRSHNAAPEQPASSITQTEQTVTPSEEKKAPYWKRVIAPDILPLWLSFIVVGVGVLYAKRTLDAIEAQVREMRSTGQQTDQLIAEAIKQSVAARDAAMATKESAEAALLNAQALINAERAWVLVDLDWNPLYQTAQVHTTIENGEQISKTIASLRINYRNHGSTPAWIIEITARMCVYDGIPDFPELHLAPVVWQGSEPLGMGQGATKDVTVEHMGRNFTGWNGRLAIIYGRVIYGDAFGKARTTTFGYELRYEKRLERLAGFPDYNQST